MRSACLRTQDRIKSAARTKAGELKKVAGKLSGDDKLKRESRREELRGEAQNTVAALKDAPPERIGRNSSWLLEPPRA